MQKSTQLALPAIVKKILGGYKPSTLTWQELKEKSDKLAYYLNKSLTSKTPVIVYGHKDPYMLVCFLACVKSGRHIAQSTYQFL